MNRSIALITDSTCDIPAHLVAQAGIRVIPVLINIGQQTLRDGLDLNRQQFYDLLPSMPAPPTTSAPAPGEFIRIYDEALSSASHVVSVHIAGKLSGVYNAARVAAEQVAPDRIHLVDSGQTSMGLGWPVLAGAEAIRSGASLEGVLHSITDMLPRVRVYALLNTLEYLARSGRVNMIRAGLGGLLDLKPLVELRDGVVSTLTRVRAWSRALALFAERAHALAPFERLAVMHTQYGEGADDFLATICAQTPCPPNTLVIPATTVIGAHVGPHALGIAAVLAKPS